MRHRLLFIGVALPLIAVLVTAGAIYVHNQRLVRNMVQSLKNAVTKDFPDPESARFRSIRLLAIGDTVRQRVSYINLSNVSQLIQKHTLAGIASLFTYDPKYLELCGEVNAKNTFGAYVGYKYFEVRGGENPIAFIDSPGEDMAKRLCAISSENVVFSEP